MTSAAPRTPPNLIEERWLPFVAPRPQVNHGQNVRWTPRWAFRPGTNIQELAAIMRWIRASLPRGTKIKAGGSRHSWSLVAATDGVYIHPEGMKFFTEPGELRDTLAPTRVENLIRVGSGTTVKELNQELWARGKSLPGLGGYDGQTIGGVLPTGTHGSVLRNGPLADVIASMDLVTADGTIVRIEPSDGITDPAVFAATHPGWRLIQDDAYFDAARINMGTFGVVHSYVLEVRDAFYLSEIRSRSTGREAQRILANENIYNLLENHSGPDGTPRAGNGPPVTFEGHPERSYHLELLWNPYSDNMIVTSREELTGEAHDALARNEPPSFAQPPTRNLFRALQVDERYSRPRIPDYMSEQFGGFLSWSIETLTRLRPSLAPMLMDLTMNAITDRRYINRSYNVFLIGDGPSHMSSQAGTLSVPLAGDQYLRAMDIMREVARDFAETHGEFQTGPISLRFVKGTSALLGDPEDVCKFEVILGGDDERTIRLTQQLMWAYYEALYAEFGDVVRFHWGHHIPQEFAAVAQERLPLSHPGLARFQEIRRELDPENRFLNEWQASLLPGSGSSSASSDTAAPSADAFVDG